MASARLTWLSLLLLSFSSPGNAQTAPTSSDPTRPRVGVVLSGGSAKGMAHVGALEVIEELGVPVDVVTGTSMGAIIGGLYAAGYSPHGLQSLIDHEDWGTFFKRPNDRRLQRMYEKFEDERFTVSFPLERARPNLPASVVSRQSIAAHLEHYLWPIHDVTDFSQLSTPFGALVTDLGTGAPILLQSGSLAQAIEASAAVPGAFAPLTLADGRTVIDGAVNRNIPAEDARAMGADILICVDVSEQILPVDRLRSLVDVVDQTVAFRVQMSNVTERPLCNVIIEPDITQLSSTDFGQSDEWIRRGRVAALAHQKALQAIADSVRKLRGPIAPRRPLPRTDSVFVDHVAWSTVSPGADAIAKGEVTLRDSMWVTQRQVEAVVARLFATGRFDQVSYRIVPRGGGHQLFFDLTEGDRDVLGIGVRYDTPRGVALLASASVADIISPGSTASLSARLGSTQQFDVRDVLGQGVNAPFLQTIHMTLTRTSLATRLTPGTLDPSKLVVRDLGWRIERSLPGGVAIGGELSHEWSDDGAPDGTGPFALHSQSVNVLAATVSRDYLDRLVAPTRGTAFFWRSEIAGPQVGSSASFTRHLVDAQGAMPIARRVSLIGNAHWGNAAGPDLPLHDLFFLGGSVPSDVWSEQFVPFLGLSPQASAGRYVRVAEAGAQVDGPDGLIIALRGNIGNVFDVLPTDSAGSGYLRGGALTLTTQLAPGPLSVTVASRSWRQRKPVIEIAFGAIF